MTPYPTRNFDIIINVCFFLLHRVSIAREKKTFEDTKELIGILKAKDRQLIQWTKDTKELITILKAKDRQLIQ